MKKSAIIFVTCVIALSFCVVSVYADPVTLTLRDGLDGYDGTWDDYIRTANSTGNLGGLSYIAAWTTTGNSLIRFDLSGIPAGATVTSATLTLRQYNAFSPGNTSVGIYRVKNTWEDGTGTTTEPDYSKGATWSYYQQTGGDLRWDSITDGASGAIGSGNINTTATDTENWNASATGATVDWDVTADVITFVNGTETNFGWLIKEDGTTVAPRFYSSEYTDDITLRPTLTVIYEVPEPATLGLLLAGGLACAVRRKR